MTAVPYTVDANIHKLGMPLFFFGVVAIYLIFFTLEMLYEADVVSRNTPVPWEWLCGISLLAWVFSHSLILGREETGVE